MTAMTGRTANRIDGLLLTPTERDDLRARLAEIEGRALALTAEIGSALADLRADTPTVALADGSVSHVFEQARWVSKGDRIQAVHGDTDWAEVLHAPVHADTQTGLVTRHADGSERIRWWAHTDLVRVAEAPVPDPTAWRAEAGR